MSNVSFLLFRLCLTCTTECFIDETLKYASDFKHQVGCMHHDYHDHHQVLLVLIFN